MVVVVNEFISIIYDIWFGNNSVNCAVFTFYRCFVDVALVDNEN